MQKLAQVLICVGPLLLAGCGGSDSSTSDSSSSSSSSGGTTTGTTTTSSSSVAISGQPSSLKAIAGADAQLSVVATGDSLTYQWSKDGGQISGATSATLPLAGVTSADAGAYTVTVTNSTGSVTSSAATITVATPSATCTTGTAVVNVMCAVTAFEATLSSSQLSTAQYDTASYTAAQLNTYRTLWSNLPGVNRAGIAYSALTSTAQQTAFYTVASVALSAAGYQDFNSVLAADDYLGTLQNGYGSSNAHIAIIGTPSATGLWTLQLGNHHMAFNLTFYNGTLYPTPHHIGVEPKAAFTVNSQNYQALAAKASALLAVFYGQTDSLSPTSSGSTTLTSAYLSGQTYSDVLLGPVEYNSGSYSAVSAKYPTSSRGLLVSSLTTAQQALVTQAIASFVDDYDSTTAAALLSDYTSSTAYASTYVAWAGSSTLTVPDLDTSNTYLRIDGPRVWIEMDCQAGVVIQGKTHYHMIYRDKTTDYYNELN